MPIIVLAHEDRPSPRIPEDGKARIISPGYVLHALNLELQAGYCDNRYLGAIALWPKSVAGCVEYDCRSSRQVKRTRWHTQ